MAPMAAHAVVAGVEHHAGRQDQVQAGADVPADDNAADGLCCQRVGQQHAAQDADQQ